MRSVSILGWWLRALTVLVLVVVFVHYVEEADDPLGWTDTIAFAIQATMVLG
jgi:hypothetical protein